MLLRRETIACYTPGVSNLLENRQCSLLAREKRGTYISTDALASHHHRLRCSHNDSPILLSAAQRGVYWKDPSINIHVGRYFATCGAPAELQKNEVPSTSFELFHHYPIQPSGSRQIDRASRRSSKPMHYTLFSTSSVVLLQSYKVNSSPLHPWSADDCVGELDQMDAARS